MKLPTVPKLGEPDVAILYSTPATKSTALTVTLFKKIEFTGSPAVFAADLLLNTLKFPKFICTGRFCIYFLLTMTKCQSYSSC
jgi:hypothetical protein